MASVTKELDIPQSPSFQQDLGDEMLPALPSIAPPAQDAGLPTFLKQPDNLGLKAIDWKTERNAVKEGRLGKDLPFTNRGTRRLCKRQLEQTRECPFQDCGYRHVGSSKWDTPDILDGFKVHQSSREFLQKIKEHQEKAIAQKDMAKRKAAAKKAQDAQSKEGKKREKQHPLSTRAGRTTTSTSRREQSATDDGFTDYGKKMGKAGTRANRL